MKKKILGENMGHNLHYKTLLILATWYFVQWSLSEGINLSEKVVSGYNFTSPKTEVKPCIVKIHQNQDMLHLQKREFCWWHLNSLWDNGFHFNLDLNRREKVLPFTDLSFMILLLALDHKAWKNTCVPFLAFLPFLPISVVGYHSS